MIKKGISLIIAICFSLMLSNATFAATWSVHTESYLEDSSYYGARGAKGDFKLPSIDSHWTSTYDENFITFEQWLYVNGTSNDWLELGYMDGAIDPENDGVREDYTGFFKAKRLGGSGGEYWESKLDKTATVGTVYTFSIVDVNASDLWEIYIGSTYFGSFSGTITRSYDLVMDQGYEFNIEPGSTAHSRDSTEITNQYYRYNGTWSPWSNLSSYVNIYNTATSYITTVSYSSSNNKTTFTK